MQRCRNTKGGKTCKDVEIQKGGKTCKDVEIQRVEKYAEM